jgi:hypothetical protein
MRPWVGFISLCGVQSLSCLVNLCHSISHVVNKLGLYLTNIISHSGNNITVVASATLKVLVFLRVAARIRDPSSIRAKELSPMQSSADLDLALRVLNTIRSHKPVKQSDAFALRMWAAPRSRMQPLEDIASEITELTNRSINEQERPDGA